MLHEEFLRLIKKEGKNKKTGIHDELFNKLKYAVIDASKSTHNWDGKAEDSLVSGWRVHLGFAGLIDKAFTRS